MAVVDLTFEVLPPFIRGDGNNDGRVNLADGIFLLHHLLLDGAEPGCEVACDVSGDGELTVADAIYLLEYRFVEGPSPPAPFPDCGGPGELDLFCELSADCAE